MRVFNLNDESEVLPFAFRQMLTALLESYLTTARYTQPSVFSILQRGLDPGSIAPRRKNATVLFSDIIGFSRFAEHISARELIDLVNSHIEVCTHWISRFGGEVNKLTGDGVLAYFSGRKSDAAIEASLGRKDLKGQSKPVEVFTLDSLPRLDLDEVYSKIDHHIRHC